MGRRSSTRARAKAWLALLLSLGISLAALGEARANFERGTLKIDVRDAKGAPLEAAVTVRPAKGGDARKATRAGQVYVVDGLVGGDWRIEVAGAPPQLVHIEGRQVLGAVFVLGAPAGGRHHSAPHFTVGPDEPACASTGGVVVEAVAFAHGGLGAGKLEVRRGKKRICAAMIAGGGATLLLDPGDYQIDARFVGGGSAHASYSVSDERAPGPLVLRAR